MAGPVEEDDTADAVKLIFAENSGRSWTFDQETRRSVDDDLSLISTWRDAYIVEYGPSWKDRNLGKDWLTQWRKEEYRRLREERRLAWEERLLTIPRKWDIWRDPTLLINVGETVDLPIPEGVAPVPWVQSLQVNFTASRKTRSFRWSFRTVNPQTVRVLKRERVYTIFDMAEMGLLKR